MRNKAYTVTGIFKYLIKKWKEQRQETKHRNTGKTKIQESKQRATHVSVHSQFKQTFSPPVA